MATHGNDEVVLLPSFITYLFCCCATIAIEKHCHLINC